MILEIHKWIKKYTKHYIFNIIILIALIIMSIINISQFVMINSVYESNTLIKNDLNKHINIYDINRHNDKLQFYDMVEVKNTELIKNINRLEMELSSRIDIVDSAIKPEKKRRELIVKVRDAITENTKTSFTIRDLNNIAISVVDYSYQYNLSIAKILAQMKQESNFIIKAHSHANAMGLMQLIPETWEYVVLKEFENKRADPYNIYHNIRAGCFYMSEQTLKFNTYNEALMAYNWGPHKVREFLAGDIAENDIPKETKLYVQNVNNDITVFEKYGLE